LRTLTRNVNIINELCGSSAMERWQRRDRVPLKLSEAADGADLRH
jgi:hypothetical protein